MSITVFCNAPGKLLSKIKKSIDDGEIKTWKYDNDGDFTHTPDQWASTAWLRPIVAGDSLVFGLLGRKGIMMTKPLYGVYHGRFIEMLLTHFDSDFSLASSTAFGTQEDSFKTLPS